MTMIKSKTVPAVTKKTQRLPAAGEDLQHDFDHKDGNDDRVDHPQRVVEARGERLVGFNTSNYAREDDYRDDKPAKEGVIYHLGTKIDQAGLSGTQARFSICRVLPYIIQDLLFENCIET